MSHQSIFSFPPALIAAALVALALEVSQCFRTSLESQIWAQDQWAKSLDRTSR
jgi:hypothetical protein